MSTNYTRGRNLEYRAEAYLKAAGYVVTRAAGSKGVADLMAMRCGRDPKLLVSCKLGKGGAPPAERKALSLAAEQAGGLAVVCWQRRPRTPMAWLVVGASGLYAEPDGEWLP